MAQAYTEASIKTLSSTEHIRLRPGMYIGRLGNGAHAEDGIYVLLKESIDNSIDEFTMGFGRKIETDFITTAVKTAVGIKKPVKVIWPREEDFGHDWYRPFAVARVRALLAADKTIGAWSFRTVTQSIMQRFGWWAPGWGADSTAIECATTKTGVPYATAAKAVEWVPLNVSIPTGFWRSVGASASHPCSPRRASAGSRSNPPKSPPDWD